MKRVSEYGEYYEQDYFNWLMKFKIWRLSLNYNSMSMVFFHKKDLWNKELQSNLKIIHFTLVKPLEGYPINELLKLWSHIQNKTNHVFPLKKCSENKL